MTKVGIELTGDPSRAVSAIAAVRGQLGNLGKSGRDVSLVFGALLGGGVVGLSGAVLGLGRSLVGAAGQLRAVADEVEHLATATATERAMAGELGDRLDNVSRALQSIGSSAKITAVNFANAFLDMTVAVEKFSYAMGPVGALVRALASATRSTRSWADRDRDLDVRELPGPRLGPHGEPLDALEGALAGGIGGPRGLEPRGARRGVGILPRPEEIRDQADAMFGELTRVEQQWRDFGERMSGEGAVLNTALGSALSGIEIGFQSLGRAMMGEKVKMVEVVRSMVSEILSQFARLAAIRFFSFLFLGPAGGPAASSVMGAPGWTYPLAGGMRAAPAAQRPRFGSGMERSINITINTLDARSVEESLRSPGGAMRRAFQSIDMRHTY